uniref:Glycosyltransferases n=1 Tax=Aegilops tauschii subsp. strangulata TaxID=200361 RepID=A0A453AJ55_AEGTS
QRPALAPEPVGQLPRLRARRLTEDSVKFVQRLAAEDYNKSRGMPNRDCSEIMVWRGDQFVAT